MVPYFRRYVVCLMLFIQSFAFIKCYGQDIDSLRVKAQNNQNPANWDVDLFEFDKGSRLIDKSKPMDWIAFPVETYDTGVFSSPFNFRLQDAIFSGVAFGENLTTAEQDFNFDYYAVLIFKTPDSIQISSDVISRNSPGITLRGRVKLLDTYDFIGIKYPDNTGTFFIGVKAFDLRFGSTIVIFPRTDGSFSYIQLVDLPESVEDFDSYVERIRNNKEIKERIKYYETFLVSDKE